jgi:2-haloacid dehalogenase
VYALSNWSAETFPMARGRYEFLSWFKEIVLSGEVGLVKPDPAIYRLAAERCGFEMAGTVFIDDSKVNVAAAAELGFDAIHFTGAQALRRGLGERGLLSGA